MRELEIERALRISFEKAALRSQEIARQTQVGRYFLESSALEKLRNLSKASPHVTISSMKLIYILFTLIFVVTSCKTSPTVNAETPDRQDIDKRIVQTIFVQDFEKSKVRANIEKFYKIIQSRKKLNSSDLELYDRLFETYKSLKYRPTQNKITIPARTKLVIPLKSYCLDNNKASPGATEPFKWTKIKNDIPQAILIHRM